MLHLVKPAEDDGLDILVSATAVPMDDERLRLAAVMRYEILDTAPEAACDSITALPADLFNVPLSIIDFVDRDRIWFKSHHRLVATEIERDASGSAAVLPSIGFILPSGAKTDVGSTNIRSTDIRSTDVRSTELRSIATPHVVGEAGRRFCIAVPLRTADGFDLGTLCVMDSQPIAVDARWIRQLETLAAIVMDQLEVRLASWRAAAQAVIMAGEDDHRTMNSLQFVASLLNLQSRAVRSTEAAGQLTAAANRVSAVARAHRTFAPEPNAERLPILAYLRRLCGELADILETSVAIDGTEASIPTEQILALGLIANELVTNAKKHGAGKIKVTFTAAGSGDYELWVLDEGEGLTEDFTLGSSNNSGGLGLKVAAALVSQLQGRLSAHPNPTGRGACFRVTFPGS
jgi:two-component sensor histidine kinase